MNDFSLERREIDPTINEVLQDLTRKNLLERAIYFGKDFNASSDELKKTAWQLFSARMDKYDFAKALKVSKDFKISPDKVKDKVRKVTEELEQKKRYQYVDILKRVFKVEKKGLFGKIFGG